MGHGTLIKINSLERGYFLKHTLWRRINSANTQFI